MRLSIFIVVMGLLAASIGVGHGAERAAALPAAPQPEVTWKGHLSGLPWASGSSSSGTILQKLRASRLDVLTMYLQVRGSWDRMVRSASVAQSYAAVLEQTGKIAVGIGLVPQSHRGQLAECAAGQFDPYIRAIGTTLLAKSEDHRLLLRLGWEANNMGSFPWAVTDDGTVWKACYRRWVAILRSLPGNWRFTMVWNMATRGTFPYHIDAMYPGNDVVDVIGVQFFDRCPVITNEATWQQRLAATRPNGSPIGLGSWLAYARSKGKLLALPEWAIGGPYKPGACGGTGYIGADNPFVIRRLFAWLKENSASLAFEAYFNAAGLGHALVTPDGRRPNPQSAAAYAELW
jgi:hypothetical protein